MVLVTGAAGLLGTELVNMLLRHGIKVRAMYHNTIPHFSSSPQLELVRADLLDVVALESVMAGISQVYHCAGLVSFHSADHNRLYKINTEGTANLINAALDASVQKFVHVSSVAALGRLRQNQLVNESMHWTKETSNSIYGHSKYLAEMEAWRGASEGLKMIIVNPVIIIGPGDWNEGSTKIFKSAYEEFPWYTDGITGFVDVRDVAEVMMKLMASDIENQRFIISAGNFSYKQLFDLAADFWKKKKSHKKVSRFMASLLWRFMSLRAVFTGSRPLLTRETVSTAMAKVNFDNSKLLKYLPDFHYRTLEETVAYTCDALQQKINNQ